MGKRDLDPVVRKAFKGKNIYFLNMAFSARKKKYDRRDTMFFMVFTKDKTQEDEREKIG